MRSGKSRLHSTYITIVYAVDHNCGLPLVNRNVKLYYTSSLDGFVLMLICENDMNITEEQILNVTCHSNGNWIPDPADFIKSCSQSVFTTAPEPPGSCIPL